MLEDLVTIGLAYFFVPPWRLAQVNGQGVPFKLTTKDTEHTKDFMIERNQTYHSS
jgi:hypothetical protein